VKSNKEMDDVANQFFDLVVFLTSVRDIRSLERALIDSLKKILNATDEIVLYRVPRNSECNYLEIAAAIPDIHKQKRVGLLAHKYGAPQVLYDQLMEECIKQKCLISDVSQERTRTLFPIAGGSLVQGVLEIDSGFMAHEMVLLIERFISIYNNVLAILHEGEHDTLTGLRNRKTFDFHLAELLTPASQSNIVDNDRRLLNAESSYWVGLLDIDFFKSVNDNFGHVYGDEVLLLFSKIIEKSFRNSDVMFRYGGEEFVVVLSPSTKVDALMVFERFRVAVEGFEFPKVGKITVSIGISSLESHEQPVAVLEFADKALYFAKQNGRNQLSHYQHLLASGLLSETVVNNDVELF